MIDFNADIKVRVRITVSSKDGIVKRDRQALKEAVEYVLKNSCNFESNEVVASFGTFGYFETSEVIPKDRIVDAAIGFFAIPEDYLKNDAEDKRLEEIEADSDEIPNAECHHREGFVEAIVEIMSRDAEVGIWISVKPLGGPQDDQRAEWLLQILDEADTSRSLLAKKSDRVL